MWIEIACIVPPAERGPVVTDYLIDPILDYDLVIHKLGRFMQVCRYADCVIQIFLKFREGAIGTGIKYFACAAVGSAYADTCPAGKCLKALPPIF